MKNNRFIILTIIILASLYSTDTLGQSNRKEYYRSPVNFEIFIAGNVGEIRATHFHTGIDIKGGGKSGAPIYAAADGYISRVGVSPTGYGNVVYIVHPNGETTVYGHLDGFEKSIAEWVKQRQYSKKSFRVDLYPTKDDFPVNQGDLIGYLGNSGSSGGPHLHYEIRNKNNQPINIVREGVLKIMDNQKPSFFSVSLYECDTVGGVARYTKSKTSNAIKLSDGNYKISDSIFYTSRPHYFTYDVIDYKNGSSNTLGIYSMEQQIDSVINFSFAIDRLSFTTSRYVNSFTQFDENNKNRTHILRAYVSANNGLSTYRNVKSRGIIEAPTVEQQVRTTIEDDNGNRSEINFIVKPDTISYPLQTTDYGDKNLKVVTWNRDFSYSDSSMQVSIVSRSLFDNELLNFSVDTSTMIYQLGDPSIPLYKPLVLSVIADSTTQKLAKKALFVNSENKAVVRTKLNNNRLEGEISRFGDYRVVLDTIAPKITPQKVQNSELRFRVTDDLSGVASYQLLIDGEWALLEWDPKSSMMIHRIENSDTPKQRKVRVTVTDYCGNSSTSNTKPTF